MVDLYEFSLGPYPRGFHVITDEVLSFLGHLPETAVLHVFIRHTSAGICINENYDPDVLDDFETFFSRLVPEYFQGMKHTVEGPDDMPAHIKAVFTGCSVTIPVSNHKLCLGTWQGIYLCEFRDNARERYIVATVIS